VQICASQRCPPSPIRKYAETTPSLGRQYTRYISAEKWQATVPAAAEVPVCDPAIAQFANPSRHQQIKSEKARRVPTVKHQIFELRSATSIQGANFAVNYCSGVRQASRDLLSKLREGSEWVPVTREQLSTAMLDYVECSEAVVLQLEDPLTIIKRSGPLQKRHWQGIWMHAEAIRIASSRYRDSEWGLRSGTCLPHQHATKSHVANSMIPRGIVGCIASKSTRRV